MAGIVPAHSDGVGSAAAVVAMAIVLTKQDGRESFVDKGHNSLAGGGG